MYYAIHGKMPLNNLYETEAAAQAGIEQMKKTAEYPARVRRLHHRRGARSGQSV